MSALLYRLGQFAARRPWVVIGSWLLAAVILVSTSSAFGRDLDDSFGVPGLDSQVALELLSSAGLDQAGLTARIVVTPKNGETFFESDQARLALAEVRAGLLELPNVLAASDPAAALGADSSLAVSNRLVSPDGRVAQIHLQYPVTGELDRGDLENLKQAVDQVRDNSVVRTEVGGELFFAFEESETGPGEMVGLVAAVVILLLAFGSVVAMGLPVGIAVFGLTLGVSSLSLVAYLIEIPSWVPSIGAMVGLGVGIDYALFVVTRHREFLASGLGVEESVARSVATAGQAVVFAGGTVVISILGLAIAGVPFMTAAGVAIALIVMIMVLASITLLPAFLGVSGHWINRLAIHRGGSAGAGGGSSSPRWERWGQHVSANAWPYALGVTALLLALSAPVLALRLGFPDDGSLAESTTQRRAYDLVSDGFGPGSNGPLLIAIDLSGEDGGRTAEAVVDELVSAVEADLGVDSVTPATVFESAEVATFLAYSTTAPQAIATVATVERLRSEVFPEVLSDSEIKAHVGGQTASISDVATRVADRLPYFIGAVIVLSFLLLTLVFRSIVVPLKAALLNLLSIGASYGILVMVFQWGWGKGLIGLESTVPIVSFIPMFMFAILFGLSMDYEVFLLSRVREEYLATNDNDISVIRGLASTARVITSAALIMISVFGGFVLSDDPVTKMFGLGLATAILIDASIVRVILVPATMKLMGNANWWIPQWLDNIMPNVDIDGVSTDGVNTDGVAE